MVGVRVSVDVRVGIGVRVGVRVIVGVVVRVPVAVGVPVSVGVGERGCVPVIVGLGEETGVTVTETVADGETVAVRLTPSPKRITSAVTSATVTAPSPFTSAAVSVVPSNRAAPTAPTSTASTTPSPLTSPFSESAGAGAASTQLTTQETTSCVSARPASGSLELGFASRNITQPEAGSYAPLDRDLQYGSRHRAFVIAHRSSPSAPNRAPFVLLFPRTRTHREDRRKKPLVCCTSAWLPRTTPLGPPARRHLVARLCGVEFAPLQRGNGERPRRTSGPGPGLVSTSRPACCGPSC